MITDSPNWLDSHSTVPKISNPVLDSENYAENWEESKFKSFKSHFNSATMTARAALDTTDYGESIKLWRIVFGSKFPSLRTGQKAQTSPGGQTKPESPPRARVQREFG